MPYPFIIFRQNTNNKKQREIIDAITETQLAERKRISQDLHDSVGGLLALAKSKLQSISDQSENSMTEVEDAVEVLASTSDQVRKISHNLMPSELVKFGLVSAIEAYVEELKQTDLDADFYPNDTSISIDEIKELHLYRILQEIVQNALKHAKATTLSIYLNHHGKYLSLMVEDNGVGMAKDATPGLGLKTITSRTNLMNGTVTFDTAEGKGTTITIKIPL